ncbi:MAG: hypothetical protein R2708_15640 [Vicinamibacterales bacterium]
MLDEGREVAPLDRVDGVLRDTRECVGFEDVDAGVDRVAGDLVSGGLLEEAPDVPVGVRLDQAVGRRVLDRGEHDRGLRLAGPVPGDHGVDVHGRHDVAVEDDDRVVHALGGEPDGAAGAERRGLDHIAQLHPERRAVAERLLEAPRLVVQAQDDFVDLGYLLQQADLVGQERPVEDGDDGLRRVQREGTQSRALAAGQQDGFHGNT